MQRLDDSGDGAEITLAPGEDLEVSLSENPTTGYRWSLAPPSDVLTVSEQPFDPGAAPGAPGRRRWRFHAQRAGEARLQFQLRQNWAPVVARAYGLSVKVR